MITIHFDINLSSTFLMKNCYLVKIENNSQLNIGPTSYFYSQNPITNSSIKDYNDLLSIERQQRVYTNHCAASVINKDGKKEIKNIKPHYISKRFLETYHNRLIVTESCRTKEKEMLAKKGYKIKSNKGIDSISNFLIPATPHNIALMKQDKDEYVLYNLDNDMLLDEDSNIVLYIGYLNFIPDVKNHSDYRQLLAYFQAYQHPDNVEYQQYVNNFLPNTKQDPNDWLVPLIASNKYSEVKNIFNILGINFDSYSYNNQCDNITFLPSKVALILEKPELFDIVFSQYSIKDSEALMAEKYPKNLIEEHEEIIKAYLRNMILENNIDTVTKNIKNNKIKV